MGRIIVTDLKWIKLDCHIFDCAELKYIDNECGANAQLGWIKLVCEAAKRNDGGRIYIRKNKAITIGEIAMLIGMPADEAEVFLGMLDELGLISYDENGFIIRNWGDYVGEGFVAADDKAETDETGASEILSEEKNRIDRHREAQRRYRERKRVSQKENLRGGSTSGSGCNGDSKSDNKAVTCDISSDFGDISGDLCDKRGDFGNNVGDITSPKNIFIEENRKEKNSIDSRRDSISEEKENNNFSLTHTGSVPERAGNTRAGFGNGSDDESFANASLPLAPPPPADAEREKNKKFFGRYDNVYLTDGELSELKEKFPDTLGRLIDELSGYMKSSGKSYADHFATLMRWGENEYSKKKNADSVRGGSATGSGSPGDRGGSYGSFSCADKNSSPSYYGSSSYEWWGDKKSSQREPCEPYKRYSDFDPDEAFRLALERSAKEFCD